MRNSNTQMIKPHNWIQLLHVVPEELKQLVSLCYEYEELNKEQEGIKEITGTDIGNLQILIQSILTEYMKIVSKDEADEKVLKTLKTDIVTTLSNWFDTKGNIKDLSQDFLASMERRQLHFHLPLFTTPATGFTHSRIYWSLIEAYRQTLSMTFFSVPNISKFATEKDWNSLSKKIYPRLCNACYDFEEFIEHLFKVAPYFNKVMENRLEHHCSEVTREYLKIVRDKDEVLSYIETLEEFIGFVNSIYYYLESARVKRDGSFRNKFVSSTKFKAGIYPEINREDKGGVGIKLPAAKE